MGWNTSLGGMLCADVAIFIPCITRVPLQQETGSRCTAISPCSAATLLMNKLFISSTLEVARS